MSLLLDALKKAAEDKKKASNGENFSVEDVENNSTDEQVEKKISEEELSLDLETNSTISKNTSQKAAEPGQTNFTETNMHVARDSVSDDALSLLIYKTNKEEKKRKRIFAIGTTMAILSVVGLGGIYYYFNLQESINSLELKHRTSMMRMEAKTNKQQPPEKTEIIDNLTANSEIKIEKKLEVIEVEDVEIKPLPREKIKSNIDRRAAKNKERLLLIEKTKQADIVGKKLELAFGDYEAGRYIQAKGLYHEVNLLEKNNRDALLGLGAIAVIEKETDVAKKHYKTLLKLDPNDPLAVSALTNLRSNEISPQKSEKYLVAMLEKTPGSAQLNFELGNVYAQQNNWSAAQKSYFKAWQKKSDNPDYIFNLAVSLDQLGQQQQAMNFYKDSLLKAKDKQVSFSRKIVEQRVTELSGF